MFIYIIFSRRHDLFVDGIFFPISGYPWQKVSVSLHFCQEPHKKGLQDVFVLYPDLVCYVLDPVMPSRKGLEPEFKECVSTVMHCASKSIQRPFWWTRNSGFHFESIKSLYHHRDTLAHSNTF